MASVYKTFTSGSVLTASEVQSYLQDQAVIVCDSSADYPTVPKEGMVVYDKALDATLQYTGSAWVRVLVLTSTGVETYTPTLTQSSTVAATVTEATYVRQGAIVEAWVTLSVTGSGSSGSAVIVSLPVTAASTLATGTTAGTTIGVGIVYDASGTSYVCDVFLRSTTTVGFRNDASAGSELGGTPAFALASGDVVKFHVRYVV